jgi:hypothetical protein
MKKIIIVLFLLSILTTSAYAVNFLNRALYEKVEISCIHRMVLVNRVTGKVEYVLGFNKKWTPIPNGAQVQYQSMYNAQIAPQ